MLWRMEHGIDWAGRSPVVVASDYTGWIRTAWTACPPTLQHRILQLTEQVTAVEPPPLPPAQSGNTSGVVAMGAPTPPLALPAPEPASPEGPIVADEEPSTASATETGRGEGVVHAPPPRKRARPVARCRSNTPRRRTPGASPALRGEREVSETPRLPDTADL
jgi:hypothetical protein